VLPPQLTKLKGAALDLLFPRFCVGCGREGAFLCDSCRASMSRIKPPICPRCGKPQPGGILCYSCTEWQAAIDGIRAPFQFEGVIREAVHQLKYRNLRALSVPLAGLMSEYLIDNPVRGDVLIPVPLHPKRLRERGYNQSALLAEELGKLVNLPVDKDSLVRERFTLPQAKTASVEERRHNVIGMFACKEDRLAGKNVLLIDDVSTSGATLDACALVLKRAGALSVWGLTLAKEI
jgi:competence protein ComFC